VDVTERNPVEEEALAAERRFGDRSGVGEAVHQAWSRPDWRNALPRRLASF
jgi:hypothetical protein